MERCTATSRYVPELRMQANHLKRWHMSETDGFEPISLIFHVIMLNRLRGGKKNKLINHDSPDPSIKESRTDKKSPKKSCNSMANNVDNDGNAANIHQIFETASLDKRSSKKKHSKGTGRKAAHNQRKSALQCDKEEGEDEEKEEGQYQKRKSKVKSSSLEEFPIRTTSVDTEVMASGKVNTENVDMGDSEKGKPTGASKGAQSLVEKKSKQDKIKNKTNVIANEIMSPPSHRR
eukprot:763776-Hanusia_phi.AAC.2